MTHRTHTRRKAVPAPADTDTDTDVAGQIVERPDGYYWQAPDSQPELGPFESYELAQASRDAAADESVERGDELRQAERDIGINDWIDAETGEPAEGQSPPHLAEE